MASSKGAAYAPRFAASIAPGPPPVATVNPARASSRPRRAAPAYASRAACHRVTAHHAHHPCAAQEFVEGVGDGVVVDGAQHRREDVAVGLGPLEPGVREGVGRRLVTAVVEPGEQLVGGVEQAAVRVEGQVRDGREDQGAVRADLRRGVLGRIGQPRKTAPAVSVASSSLVRSVRSTAWTRNPASVPRAETTASNSSSVSISRSSWWAAWAGLVCTRPC